MNNGTILQVVLVVLILVVGVARLAMAASRLKRGRAAMAPPELRPIRNVWLSRAKIRRARLSLSPTLRFRSDGTPEDDPQRVMTFLKRTALRQLLPENIDQSQFVAYRMHQIIPSSIFVVCRGEVESNGRLFRTGDSFGALSFIQAASKKFPRAASNDLIVFVIENTGLQADSLLKHCRELLGHELRVARFALEQWEIIDEPIETSTKVEHENKKNCDYFLEKVSPLKSRQQYTQGQKLPRGLHIVVQGQVYDKSSNSKLSQGCVAGLGFLCGEKNVSDRVFATEDGAEVISLTQADFSGMTIPNQVLIESIRLAAEPSRGLLERWSRSGLRRRFVRAGEKLACDSAAYLVLSGRIRSLRYSSRGKSLRKLSGARDAQRGDVVGLTDLLFKEKNVHDFSQLESYAARDAEVVALSRTALNIMPASCALSLVRRQLQRKVGNARDSGGLLLEPSILCVLPTSAAAVGLASALALALAEDGFPHATKCHPLRVDHDVNKERAESLHKIKCVDGKAARQRFSEYLEDQADFFAYGRAKIATTWLAALESQYEKVVLIADLEATAWTRVAVSSADAVLLVAESSNECQLGPGERELMLHHSELPGARPRLLLALCHPPETVVPKNTRDFLAPRPHLDEPRVIHIRRSHNNFYMSDLRRLARFLAGRAIGLVLGGGGARGLAHLGALRSLEAARVEIDVLMGCSQGAMVALLAAKESGWPSSNTKHKVDVLQDTESRLKRFASCLTSTRKVVMDLNWLRLFAVSTFTGRGFATAVASAFDSEAEAMEDSWLPRYCVTTDATLADERVHGCGDDGPESCLASMSVCGYFPPIVYSRDGHLLVDGGYCSNLPAAQMRSIVGDAGLVIAVDVEAKTHNLVLDPTEYHWKNGFSGTRGLVAKVLGTSHFVTSASDLASQLLYIRNAAQLRDARTSGAFDICLRLESVMRFSFTAYDQLHDIANAAQAQAASLIQTHLADSEPVETLLSPRSVPPLPPLPVPSLLSSASTASLFSEKDEKAVPSQAKPTIPAPPSFSRSLSTRVAASLSAPKTKAVLRRLCSFPSPGSPRLDTTENRGLSAFLDSFLQDREDLETAWRRRKVSVDAPLGVHRDGHIVLGSRMQDSDDDNSLDENDLDEDLETDPPSNIRRRRHSAPIFFPPQHQGSFHKQQQQQQQSQEENDTPFFSTGRSLSGVKQSSLTIDNSSSFLEQGIDYVIGEEEEEYDPDDAHHSSSSLPSLPLQW